MKTAQINKTKKTTQRKNVQTSAHGGLVERGKFAVNLIGILIIEF